MVSKGVRSRAEEVPRTLEEDTLCTEGLAQQQQGAAPGAATKASGAAGNPQATKAKTVKQKV